MEFIQKKQFICYGGTYVINLCEFNDIETHWVALCVKDSDVTYFDSFRLEHIPKDIKRFTKDRNIISNISRTQAYDLKIYGNFYIGFMVFSQKKILKVKK